MEQNRNINMEYQNYIFDLYGTLADIHTDEERPEFWEKMRIFYDFYGAEYASDELHDTYRKLVGNRVAILDRKSVYSYPEVDLQAVFGELYTCKGICPSGELLLQTGRFFRKLSTDYLRLYDGVKKVLEYLRECGKHIYLLSNAQSIFTLPELRILGIDKYFDGILLSSDCGVKKPDPRFFQMLLDKYLLEPQECLMIGNDINADIAGAANVGIESCYICTNLSPENNSKVSATYVIDTLQELLTINMHNGGFCQNNV